MAIDLKGMPDEPAPANTVTVANLEACSNIVLVCEHASNFIPPQFDNLGLDPDLQRSHIAWDPGALAVAKRLSEQLDATLVHQNVSRLLYDCNRPPEAASAIPELSEIHPIPGNRGLTPAQKAQRVEEFYEPFHRALGALIAQRIAAGRPPVLTTIHSFTPVYKSIPRAVEVGILHDADSRLADRMLAAANAKGGHVVARNQPYGPKDGVTHTLKRHGLSNKLCNVMIEIRNDLVRTPADHDAMALWLEDILRSSQSQMEAATG